ncbi:response regulator [Antarcticibacterium sp. 1MA-6-2]|uniref:response regulator n=1 Tax=Antarcticibacterium sp. 1MA-6-2 TaxID=2908210 RepID=UPI001F41B764|nr:response regulator [Antarcticibacterium sp. 1MA-6-2]UJH92162.1 response regulator [Antarcticibacterium sp. 1MA-6-2]
MKEKRDELLEILLVEDDDVVGRLHRFAVENLVDNEVRIMENGKEAIDYLENTRCANKNFLILLDLNMPVMNGWQFLESLHEKEYTHKIFVHILTSSSYKEDYIKSQRYDRVMGYHTKPLTRTKLLEILESNGQVSEYLEKQVVKKS